MSPTNIVYVGIKGSVLALDRGSGRQLWTAKLKGDEFVNLLVDGDRLFATARGEIFCLDAANGNLLWHDPLKGFGWGLATIATAQGSTPIAAAEVARQRQAAAAASAAAAA